MANLECNAVSAVQVTHLLLGRMRAKKLRGCFVYTSSGAVRCGRMARRCTASPRRGIAASECSNAAADTRTPVPLPFSCGHDPQPLQRALRLHQVLPLL